MSKEERKLIGYVGVDSGQLFITDPCYLANGGWKDENDFGVNILGIKYWGSAQENVRDFLEKKYQIESEKRGDAYFVPVDDTFDFYELKSDIKEYADSINKIIVIKEFTNSSYDLISDLTLTKDAGEILNGVAFSSGFGDGLYPVYATFREFEGLGEFISKIEVELIENTEETHLRKIGVINNGCNRKRGS
mgnify:CR=1 FL=1